jgi:hypothetical protein
LRPLCKPSSSESYSDLSRSTQCPERKTAQSKSLPQINSSDLSQNGCPRCPNDRQKASSGRIAIQVRTRPAESDQSDSQVGKSTTTMLSARTQIRKVRRQFSRSQLSNVELHNSQFPRLSRISTIRPTPRKRALSIYSVNSAKNGTKIRPVIRSQQNPDLPNGRDGRPSSGSVGSEL